jgi:hypothetical protein
MSVQFAPRVAAGVNLDELVDALLRADADILEIVLFGSAAYAPDLARDIDLLILTRHKKEMDTYWDEIFALDLTLDVDTLLKEPGEIWNEHIALSVAAVGISLYGNHLTFEEAQKNMGVPTFEEARKLIIDADDNLDLAHRKQDPFYIDRRYRKACDALFDAARYAAMCFIASDDTRWKFLARQLPQPFENQFRELISILHVQYHYDGIYPQDDPDKAYFKWRAIVVQFIDDLEQETKSNTTEKETE